MRVDPRSLLDRLGRDIGAVLGDRLLGLYVHGSWVLGDFQDDRSDLDLLAVVTGDPSGLLEPLRAMRERLTADHPEWTDRIEVEYASTAALAGFRNLPRPGGQASKRAAAAWATEALPAWTDLVTWAATHRYDPTTTPQPDRRRKLIRFATEAQSRASTRDARSRRAEGVLRP